MPNQKDILQKALKLGRPLTDGELDVLLWALEDELGLCPVADRPAPSPWCLSASDYAFLRVNGIKSDA